MYLFFFFPSAWISATKGRNGLACSQKFFTNIFSPVLLWVFFFVYVFVFFLDKYQSNEFRHHFSRPSFLPIHAKVSFYFSKIVSNTVYEMMVSIHTHNAIQGLWQVAAGSYLNCYTSKSHTNENTILFLNGCQKKQQTRLSYLWSNMSELDCHS